MRAAELPNPVFGTWWSSAKNLLNLGICFKESEEIGRFRCFNLKKEEKTD